METSEHELERLRLTNGLLEEHIKKLQTREPAWERLLKSSLAGVVIGALLSLAGTAGVQYLRINERESDLRTARLQGALQALDEMGTAMYDFRADALVLASLFLPSPEFSETQKVPEAAKAFDESYKAVLRKIPIALLKLRRNVEPERYRAIQSYAALLPDRAIQAHSVLSLLTKGTEDAKAYVQRRDDAHRKVGLAYGCSSAIVDFSYALVTVTGTVAEEEEQIPKACEIDDQVWHVFKQQAGRAK